MAELIIQYILIVFLVVGIVYLTYFLKEKGVIRNGDYFGITYTILGMLGAKESTPENVKKILRIVAYSVQLIESNFKDEENTVKEEKALELAKEGLKNLDLISEVSDNSLRYLIRLACALLSPTNKNE